MVRNLLPPLAGVLVMLALPGCYASPLYVQSNVHRGTVGEIPRDGNGEPMWGAVPRPLAVSPGPNIAPAPGIPITGPGVAEMRDTPAVSYAPPPAPGIPVTGPGVAEMRSAPAYAPPAEYAPPPAAYRAPVPQSTLAPRDDSSASPPLYAAPAGSPYILSPLAPDATKAEIRKRTRDRRRACAHLRDCPADIRP